MSTRAARQFARALESPTRHGASRHDVSTRQMVELTHRLSTMDLGAGPDPEFRDRLRQRLIAVGTVANSQQEVPKPRSPLADRIHATRERSHRRLAFAASALTVLVITGGFAVAESHRALPGDMLYGLKRTTENVQVSLAGSDTAAGHEHLSIAATRLSEIRDLIGQRGGALGPIRYTASGGTLSAHEAKLVMSTLDDMDQQTRDGSVLLTKTAAKSGRTKPLTDLDHWARSQRNGVRAVHALVDGAAADRASASVQLLSKVINRVTALLGQPHCSGPIHADSLGVLPRKACPMLPQQANTGTQSTTPPTHSAGSGADTGPGSAKSSTTAPSSSTGDSSTPPSSSTSPSSSSSSGLPSSPESSGTPNPSSTPTGLLPTGLLPTDTSTSGGVLPSWLVPGLLPSGLLPIN
jgi:uncharacterized protein DUF5667